MRQYVVGFFFAIFATSLAHDLALFENALDVGVYETSSARNLNCGNIKLPFGCYFSPDCTTKICKINFANIKIIFQIKINQCASPVTVTVSLEVPQLNINFAPTIPTDQVIPVPGLGQGFGPLQGGVFIYVKMRSDGSNLNLMVQLQCGIVLGNAPLFPIKLDLLKGRLPIDTSGCGDGGVVPPPPPGGNGGSLPGPPPACNNTNPLCGFLAAQCSNPAVSGMCKKTCKQC